MGHRGTQSPASRAGSSLAARLGRRRAPSNAEPSQPGEQTQSSEQENCTPIPAALMLRTPRTPAPAPRDAAALQPCSSACPPQRPGERGAQPTPSPSPGSPDTPHARWGSGTISATACQEHLATRGNPWAGEIRPASIDGFAPLFAEGFGARTGCSPLAQLASKGPRTLLLPQTACMHLPSFQNSPCPRRGAAP